MTVTVTHAVVTGAAADSGALVDGPAWDANHTITGLTPGVDIAIQRTITGTANEITVTNGDGVSGNPTLSLPTALTLTGKTVTGGTFAAPTITGTLATANQTITSTSATALAVGANGTTNPVLTVDDSTASVATGLKLTGAATASRMALSVTSSGSNEGLSIDALGSGSIRFGATSTGAVQFSRNAVPTASDGAALGTTALMWSDLFLASGGVINWNNGTANISESSGNLNYNVGSGKTHNFFGGDGTFPIFNALSNAIGTPACFSVGRTGAEADIAIAAAAGNFWTSAAAGDMVVRALAGKLILTAGYANGGVVLDTSDNLVAGAKLSSSSPTSGVGYSTGAGGTVTQATSRTTGVTLNKVCGAITLVSAAGSASYQTFTVTNSAVAATDVVTVNQKSGTDLNEILVTAIGAGSFNITFRTTGGTTTEQPVFNFSIGKAVTS